MPLSLVKRSTNGAPVSAVQNDANMAAIEGAVNTNTTNIATLTSSKASTTAVTSLFASVDVGTGKGLVDWENVYARPGALSTPTLFKATKTDAVQTVSATGGFVVHFPTENFDYNNGYDTGTYRFTAPFSGIYGVGTSVQVSLASGSPTNVSIVISLRVNGSAVDQVTLDNTGTGTRIYRISTLQKLTAGDYMDVYADFTFSSAAVWQVDANNTNFWANWIYQHA